MIDVAHDRNHRRPRRGRSSGCFFRNSGELRHILGCLLFESDDGGFGAEMASQVLGQVFVERLVHRGQHSLHDQARDQIFRANFELLRQIFDADAFGNRDRACDWQRLIRYREPRRRYESLHRSFFRTLLMALAWTAGRCGATRWPARAWRRNAGTNSAHTWTRREARAWRAGRMRTATLLAWTRELRPRTRPTGALGPWTLEDWLAAN